MNRYTATDFFGCLGWIGGTEQERIARLAAYEDTGLEPEEIERLKRDVEKYTGIGLNYEAEITRMESAMARQAEQLKAAVAIINQLKGE